MSCIWNGNLHGWRVNRSNRHSQKLFLHPDYWIQPKSRECDKHISSFVRLRFGPVAASLNILKDNGHFTHHHYHMCTADNHSGQNNTYLWRSMHIWHAPTDQWIHATKYCSSVWIHQALFGSIHAVTSEEDVHNIIPCFNSSYIPHHDSSSWMPLIIYHYLENTLYGMQQSQHYNFGWQT